MGTFLCGAQTTYNRFLTDCFTFLLEFRRLSACVVNKIKKRIFFLHFHSAEAFAFMALSIQANSF